MMQLPEILPLWLGIPVILLLLAGSVVTLIGALGLLRLPHFYQRMHGPSISITFGTGCFILASMAYFTGLEQRPVVHELLITAFIFLTAPVSAMLIMRAAVYRDLRNENKKTTENLHQNQAKPATPE